MGDSVGIVLIVAGAVLLVTFLWAVLTYNRFVGLRQHIRESWSDIDVELKRRYGLIPNLVEAVKGYASYERETLERVSALRNKAMGNEGSAASQAIDESELLRGLKRLFVLAEAYPDLKADESYLRLQRELALTEDRIAAARRFFNGNVRDMNILREGFPTNIIGNVFRFEPGSFFELDDEAERVVPRVDM